MLIPLFGIAQTPSSLALNEHLAPDAEDKMLLLKNIKDAILDISRIAGFGKK